MTWPNTAAVPRRMLGITLIELMVVVAVLAILGTIAVSTYRRQAIRANRVDGTAMLLRVQVAQEKFFLQNNTYASQGQLPNAPPAGLGIALVTPGGHYNLTMVNTATTYTVTATATGGQTADVAACLVYTINEQGARTPAAATGCWR